MRTFSTSLIALPTLAFLLACPVIGDQTSGGTTEPEPDTTASSEPPPTSSSSGGLELLCTPGQERCADDKTREVCKATGLDWKQEPCDDHQVCNEIGSESMKVASCVGPCEKASDIPNSVGCEFLALRVRSGNGEEDLAEFYDALIVGNPDPETAEVQLYFAENGSHQELPLGDPVLLASGESHEFQLTNDTIKGFSAIRNGGIYRMKSDIPVIAYLHSPLKNSNSNDSSLLLPVKTLRQDYVVASYPAFADPNDNNLYAGRPSFFNVIALENGTNIEWTPKRDSAGNGVNLKPVTAGMTGSIQLNKLDVVQVGASTLTNPDFSTHDISGTVIHADKPIWVLGGTACAKVPYEAANYCNHLQEQMIPIEYWGTKYVAAHSPLRATEKHYWRIYAGEPGVTVTTDPPQPGTPFPLANRGDYKELIVKSGASFTFQGTGAFMPVQYLASYSEANKIGDPAMYQMIPIEQFIKRYVFATGKGYQQNYAQVIRVKDAAEVKINGQVVTGYYLINSVNGLRYEVADFPLDPGDEAKVYIAESDDDFGVMIVGYTSTPGMGGSAYAYPGGMALRPLVDL